MSRSPRTERGPIVGRIIGAHGIRGEVKVEPATEFTERFLPGSSLRVGESVLTIETCRATPGRLLIRFKDVRDRTSAELLQWHDVHAIEPLVHAFEADEYLTADLVGMNVSTTAGRFLGFVTEVLPYPAHDVLVAGGLMIPAVRQFVKSVDLKSRRITVELIEGMEPASELESEAPSEPVS